MLLLVYLQIISVDSFAMHSGKKDITNNLQQSSTDKSNNIFSKGWDSIRSSFRKNNASLPKISEVPVSQSTSAGQQIISQDRRSSESNISLEQHAAEEEISNQTKNLKYNAHGYKNANNSTFIDVSLLDKASSTIGKQRSSNSRVVEEKKSTVSNVTYEDLKYEPKADNKRQSSSRRNSYKRSATSSTSNSTYEDLYESLKYKPGTEKLSSDEDLTKSNLYSIRKQKSCSNVDIISIMVDPNLSIEEKKSIYLQTARKAGLTEEEIKQRIYKEFYSPLSQEMDLTNEKIIRSLKHELQQENSQDNKIHKSKHHANRKKHNSETSKSKHETYDDLNTAFVQSDDKKKREHKRKSKNLDTAFTESKDTSIDQTDSLSNEKHLSKTDKGQQLTQDNVNHSKDKAILRDCEESLLFNMQNSKSGVLNSTNKLPPSLQDEFILNDSIFSVITDSVGNHNSGSKIGAMSIIEQPSQNQHKPNKRRKAPSRLPSSSIDNLLNEQQLEQTTTDLLTNNNDNQSGNKNIGNDDMTIDRSSYIDLECATINDSNTSIQHYKASIKRLKTNTLPPVLLDNLFREQRQSNVAEQVITTVPPPPPPLPVGGLFTAGNILPPPPLPVGGLFTAGNILPPPPLPVGGLFTAGNILPPPPPLIDGLLKAQQEPNTTTIPPLPPQLPVDGLFAAVDIPPPLPIVTVNEKAFNSSSTLTKAEKMKMKFAALAQQNATSIMDVAKELKRKVAEKEAEAKSKLDLAQTVLPNDVVTMLPLVLNERAQDQVKNEVIQNNLIKNAKQYESIINTKATYTLQFFDLTAKEIKEIDITPSIKTFSDDFKQRELRTLLSNKNLEPNLENLQNKERDSLYLLIEKELDERIMQTHKIDLAQYYDDNIKGNIYKQYYTPVEVDNIRKNEGILNERKNISSMIDGEIQSLIDQKLHETNPELFYKKTTEISDKYDNQLKQIPEPFVKVAGKRVEYNKYLDNLILEGKKRAAKAHIFQEEVNHLTGEARVVIAEKKPEGVTSEEIIKKENISSIIKNYGDRDFTPIKPTVTMDPKDKKIAELVENEQKLKEKYKGYTPRREQKFNTKITSSNRKVELEQLQNIITEQQKLIDKYRNEYTPRKSEDSDNKVNLSNKKTISELATSKSQEELQSSNSLLSNNNDQLNNASKGQRSYSIPTDEFKQSLIIESLDLASISTQTTKKRINRSLFNDKQNFNKSLNNNENDKVTSDNAKIESVIINQFQENAQNSNPIVSNATDINTASKEVSKKETKLSTSLSLIPTVNLKQDIRLYNGISFDKNISISWESMLKQNNLGINVASVIIANQDNHSIGNFNSEAKLPEQMLMHKEPPILLDSLPISNITAYKQSYNNLLNASLAQRNFSNSVVKVATNKSPILASLNQGSKESEISNFIITQDYPHYQEIATIFNHQMPNNTLQIKTAVGDFAVIELRNNDFYITTNNSIGLTKLLQSSTGNSNKLVNFGTGIKQIEYNKGEVQALSGLLYENLTTSSQSSFYPISLTNKDKVFIPQNTMVHDNILVNKGNTDLQSTVIITKKNTTQINNNKQPIIESTINNNSDAIPPFSLNMDNLITNTKAIKGTADNNQNQLVAPLVSSNQKYQDLENYHTQIQNNITAIIPANQGNNSGNNFHIESKLSKQMIILPKETSILFDSPPIVNVTVCLKNYNNLPNASLVQRNFANRVARVAANKSPILTSLNQESKESEISNLIITPDYPYYQEIAAIFNQMHNNNILQITTSVGDFAVVKLRNNEFSVAGNNMNLPKLLESLPNNSSVLGESDTSIKQLKYSKVGEQGVSSLPHKNWTNSSQSSFVSTSLPNINQDSIFIPQNTMVQNNNFVYMNNAQMEHETTTARGNANLVSNDYQLIKQPIVNNNHERDGLENHHTQVQNNSDNNLEWLASFNIVEVPRERHIADTRVNQTIGQQNANNQQLQVNSDQNLLASAGFGEHFGVDLFDEIDNQQIQDQNLLEEAGFGEHFGMDLFDKVSNQQGNQNNNNNQQQVNTNQTSQTLVQGTQGNQPQQIINNQELQVFNKQNQQQKDSQNLVNSTIDPLEKLKNKNNSEIFVGIQKLRKTPYDKNRLLTKTKEIVLKHMREVGSSNQKDLEHATMLFDAKGDNDASKLVADTGNFSTLAQVVEAIKKNIAVNTSVQGVTEHSINQINNSLSNRVHTMTSASTPIPVASGDDNYLEQAQFSVWAMPLYNQANQKAQGLHLGYKAKSVGGIVGVDTSLNNNKTVIGTALSVISSDVKYKTGYKDKTKADTVVFSLYSKHNIAKGLFVQGLASYSSTKARHKEERIFSSNNQIAKANYRSRSYGGEVLLGYEAKFANNVLFMPLAGISYIKFRDEGYRETGLLFANRTVSANRRDRTDAVIGFKLSTYMNTSNDIAIIPEVHYILSRRVSGKAGKIIAKIDGMDQAFTEVPNIVKIISNLGVSITAKSGSLEYGVGYDLQLAKKYIGHQGTLKVRINF